MFDALLVVSFGGPEGPDDVMPFLRNVVRGRNVPDERLAEVAEHYHHFGGVSPINAQNRELVAAIEADLAAHGVDTPVYWGNRNWDPYLADTLARMRDDGVTHAAAFVTAAYASYSACRQYREDIARARAAVGPDAPRVTKLPHYYDHPGFVAPQVDAVRAALASLSDADPATTQLVFTAHSVPVSMNAASGDGGAYERQLREASAEVARRAAPEIAYDLVWQSRSGPPHVAWLEPDVNVHLEKLAAQGVRDVVVSPVGFVSDHLEVRWDLDEEAAATARRLGMGFARAATPGTDPRFVAMVRELVRDATSQTPAPGDERVCPSVGCCGTACCV